MKQDRFRKVPKTAPSRPSPSDPPPYRTLKVPKSASPAQIKKAFFSLTLKYHPDKNKGNRLAERLFRQINEAYRILSDPERRRAFDREWAARSSRAAALRARHAKKGKGAPAGAAPHRKGPLQEKPLDLSLSFSVSLEDLFSEGAPAVLNYLRPVGGKKEKKRLSFRLPKGVSPGQTLKFKGKGGAAGTKLAGDLYIKIVLKPHKLFSVRGKDVFLDMILSFCDVLSLKKIPVPTAFGQTVMMTVPDNIRSGNRLRLKGLGASSGRSGGKGGERGDMLVRLIAEFPKEGCALPSPLQARDFEGLRRLPEEERRRLIQDFQNKKELFPKAAQYKALVASFLRESRRRANGL